MKIYRLQSTKDRKTGAYDTTVRTGFLWLKLESVGGMLSNHKEGQNHPLPQDDILLGPKWLKLIITDSSAKQYYFGFTSYAELTAWFFRKDLYSTIGKKVVVGVYEVPDEYVLTGNNQSAFFMDKAVLLYTHSLNELGEHYESI